MIVALCRYAVFLLSSIIIFNECLAEDVAILKLRSQLSMVRTLRLKTTSFLPNEKTKDQPYTGGTSASDWIKAEEASILYDAESMRSYQTTTQFFSGKEHSRKPETSVHAFDGANTFTLNESRRSGTISFSTDRRQMLPLYTPLLGAGYAVFWRMDATAAHLNDLFATHSVQRVESNTYRILNIDQHSGEDEGNYDLEFAIDDNAGSMPLWLKIIERAKERDAIVTKQIESHEYFERDGIWMPGKVVFLKFRSVDGTRYPYREWMLVTSPEDIETNPQVSDQDFQLRFSSDTRVVDFRKRNDIKDVNGKPISQQSTGSSRLLIAPAAIFLLVLIAWLKRPSRKRYN